MRVIPIFARPVSELETERHRDPATRSIAVPDVGVRSNLRARDFLTDQRTIDGLAFTLGGLLVGVITWLV